MDYRIEKLEAFPVLCRRKTVKKFENETAAADISAFWEECKANGSIRKLIDCFPKEPKLKGLLGICFRVRWHPQIFPMALA